MREVRVGRVLAASLHQAIADLLPTRLEFYEHWLRVDSLHEGTIGVAPMQAVFSFLRQEGDVYHAVMRQAGRDAARWMVAAMSGAGRALVKRLPVFLRRRALLIVAGRFVRQNWQESRVSQRARGGVVRVDVKDSIFCGVREPIGHPLCAFHAALYSEILALFDVQSEASVVACRAMGSDACTLEILTAAASPGGEAAAA